MAVLVFVCRAGLAGREAFAPGSKPGQALERLVARGVCADGVDDWLAP